MGWLSRWTVHKRLLCPVCGDMVADAVHRQWPGKLAVHAPAGYEVVPRRSGTVERDLDEGRLARLPDADEVRAMLHRHPADLVYELICRRGHVTVRAAPDITHAVRRATGDWVRLS